LINEKASHTVRNLLMFNSIWVAIMLTSACAGMVSTPSMESALPIPKTEISESIPTDIPVLTEAETEIELGSIFTEELDIPMGLVPAGPFSMGSNSGTDDEQPVHTVFLDDFYIDLYEVTNVRFAECVDAGVCDTPADTTSLCQLV
jgi:formylglycine-generating enzyme required for sulfatase activity